MFGSRPYVATYGDDGRGESVVACSRDRVNVPSPVRSSAAGLTQKAKFGPHLTFIILWVRMTGTEWAVLLLVLIISPRTSLGENICSLSYCQCEAGIVECRGDDKEQVILSPSSLPSSITSLSLSSLQSLHIKTNTFREHLELLTLILDNISTIQLDSFIFSETEYEGFLRTFEMNNVQDLNLVEDSFNNAPQCGNSTFRNISIKVQRQEFELFSML